MQERSCYNCRYLLRFTPAEAETYRRKLATLGLEGDFFGGCTVKWRSQPLLVRRYLDRPVEDCPRWQEGYFQDNVGVSCPECREGQVVVVRPAKEKRTYTLIGCSRHPACGFSSFHLPLQTTCRYCQVSLVLSAGEKLAVYCPRCRRKAPVPMTLAGWPRLLEGGETCPHDLDWDDCRACEISMKEGRNIVDLELPFVAQYWLKLREPLPAHERDKILWGDAQRGQEEDTWQAEVDWWWEEVYAWWWTEARLEEEDWFWEYRWEHY